MVFASIPRKIQRRHIQVPEAEGLTRIRQGIAMDGMNSQEMARICLLLALEPESKESYIGSIEALFRTAEMNEPKVLYMALPLLAFPGAWRLRCAEGIRSNMAPVLEALMYQNPYPAEHLDQNAWNQMILKAFFTNKKISLIYGLEERMNPELAKTLSDYVHERWAAGREIDLHIWRFVVYDWTAQTELDIRRVWESGSDKERGAVLLALDQCDTAQTRELQAKLSERMPIKIFENWKALDEG